MVDVGVSESADEEESESVDGAEPALVDEEEFESVEE